MKNHDVIRCSDLQYLNLIGSFEFWRSLKAVLIQTNKMKEY